MRKILYTLIIILIIITNQNSTFVLAETKYARIEKTTEIYKLCSSNTNLENIICLAEATYYVEIIGDFNEFLKVNYNGITGYVKKNDVKEISNIPSTPYPYNIKITMGTNCNLRETPTTRNSTSNVISTIYANNNEIKFIGRVIGEEAIDFGGNTWYYVYYNGNYGYIYNNYIKSITPIYANNESYTYAEELNNNITNPITHTPSLIIIVILSIPIVAILIILYLPIKNKRKKSKIKKTKEIEIC